ncbi:hypothetical protein [Steroidobacter agaridevorans]|uniref:hypothetical protein n=1 Tax=Steroidobacter agaridevorans TaxID=2695856 RepID=UPI0013293751|nr:hypothetical protein [Steroidobacter agaridevorans]GFE86490.1 hypothetical protein GCM10011488_14440 [Steroidobacter agaridevorans]
MRKFVASILLTFPMLASAAGWQPMTTVTDALYEGEDDASRFYVMFGSPTNPDGCAYVGYSRVNGTTPKGKGMISMIMLAIATGQQVQAKLEGCDDWGRPLVTALRVSQ